MTNLRYEENRRMPAKANELQVPLLAHMAASLPDWQTINPTKIFEDSTTMATWPAMVSVCLQHRSYRSYVSSEAQASSSGSIKPVQQLHQRFEISGLWPSATRVARVGRKATELQVPLGLLFLVQPLYAIAPS